MSFLKRGNNALSHTLHATRPISAAKYVCVSTVATLSAARSLLCLHSATNCLKYERNCTCTKRGCSPTVEFMDFRRFQSVFIITQLRCLGLTSGTSFKIFNAKWTTSTFFFVESKNFLRRSRDSTHLFPDAKRFFILLKSYTICYTNILFL